MSTPYRFALLPLVALLAFASNVDAQGYPARPIRLVVPFAPGGSTDVILRIVGARMSESLGQQVVIDNRAGGAATIGMDNVAKSPPDGYTLGAANITFGANPFILSKLPYDTRKDFAPVSLVAHVPLVLCVHPSLPVRSVKQLIALAKAQPGSLIYSSAGIASGSHLAMALFNYMTDTRMVHVPYKGGGPQVIAAISGESAVLFATTPSALQQFRTGRLVPLAVTSLKRNPTLPEVPTIDESGLRGYEHGDWIGLVVPTGTPGAIIARLSQDTVKALEHAEVKERIAAVGATPIGTSPEGLAAHIEKEFAKWPKVIKAAGIRLD